MGKQNAISHPLCTGDMKSSEAVLSHALDAGADALLLTDEAGESAPCGGHLLDFRNRLEQLNISESDFWDPEGTENMRPHAAVRLLHGAVRHRAKNAADRASRRRLTPTAEPLALGDVRYSVALLMNGKVATVAEENDICVLTVAVETYCTDDVVVFGGRESTAGGTLRLGSRVALFLQPIHHPFKHILVKNLLPQLLPMFVIKPQPNNVLQRSFLKTHTIFILKTI